MSRLIILFTLLMPSGVFATQVENLRVWHAPDQTRLVLDLSGSVKFEIFAMHRPARVVIDLMHTSLGKPLALPPQIQGRILGLRFGPHGTQQDLRVVLDLAHDVDLRKALLPPHPPYGHRLVVDLIDREGTPNTGAPLAVGPTSLPEPPAEVAAQASPSPPVALVPTTSPMLPAGSQSPASPNPAAVKRAAISPTAPVTAPPGIPAEASRPAIPVLLPTSIPPLHPYVIAIDAGHGGEDVGAIGPFGTYEKDVVLALARQLAALINEEPNMRAVLTRDGDYFVELRNRMVRARKKHADMFISIHADSVRNHSVRGSSVFVLSQRGATSEAARWVAEHENASDLVGGVALDDKDNQVRSVLLDLSQTASLEASLDVADRVLVSLGRVGTIHRERVQAAGFMVLKSPDIPSILIETAYISNPAEERMLRDEKFQHTLAGAIRDGVKRYFYAAPAGSHLAQVRRHMVEQGDTLSRIAERYEVSSEQIMAANNRRDRTVRLGEVLRIP